MSTSRQIVKRTGVVAFFTFISRITGLIRDAAIAYAFGTQASADIFYVAFRIPNLLRSLLAEGSLTQAFVPVFTQTLKDDPKEAKKVVDIAFTLLLFILTAVVLFGISSSSLLVSWVAWGFRDSPEKLDLTVSLTRIVFPYIGMVSLMALAMGVLNSLKRFAAPAFAPILLNIGLIAGALVLTRYVDPPVYALAIGALVGGLLQLFCQVPSLYKTGMLPRLRFNFRHPAIRQIGRLMLPSVYGSAVYQINVFAITFFASFLPVGAVSYLWYAGRIMEFPLGVFAIALSTAILPSFADAAVERNRAQFKETLLFGIEMIGFINIPAAVGLYVLATPITVLLLHRGAFDAASAAQTASALQAFAIGLPFISGVRILVSAYYALRASKIPAMMATAAVVANIVFCLLLRGPLGHVGLALATTLSSAVNVIGLAFLMHRYVEDVHWRAMAAPFLRILATSALMGAGLWVFSRYAIGDPLELPLFSILLHVMAAIALGVVIYFAANFNNPLLLSTRQSARRRLGRTT